MAEEYKAESGEQHEVEVKERGLFDHFNKKDEEEKSHEDVLVTGVENVHIEEVDKKEGFLHKLHRSNSSSSSSSDEEEEVEVDGVVVKQKKKKGLKEKIKEKLGHKKEEEEVKQEVVEVKHEVAAATVITDNYGDTEVKVEKVDEKIKVGETQEEEKKEKKGILEKIMEKLPGYHKEEKDEKASPASH